MTLKYDDMSSSQHKIILLIPIRLKNHTMSKGYDYLEKKITNSNPSITLNFHFL